jgi:hypothetical protein
MWKTCPLANKDVLEVDPRDRPKCPFETAQYNASLTDALARVDTNPQADALTRHTAHHVAMLQVMTMRAASAMAEHALVDTTVTTAKEYQKTDMKPGVYMQAFLRLSAELRRFAKLLESEDYKPMNTPVKHAYETRMAADTEVTPEAQATLQSPRDGTMRRAFDAFWDASSEARRGSTEKARDLLAKARGIDADYIAQLLDPSGAHWNPTYEKLLHLAHSPT